jgi:hypothetical protein
MSKKTIKKQLDELKDPTMSIEEWVEYTDDIATSLGWFIIAFNDLDREISIILAELVIHKNNSEPALAYLLTDNKNFRDKIRALETLLNYRISEKAEKGELSSVAKKLTEEILTLNKQRNAWVHADWYETEKEENAVIIKSKTRVDNAGVYHEYFKCEPEEIEQLEEKCEELVERLHTLLNEIIKQK